MMPPIELFVSGIPKGQPRPKAFSRGGIASVYDPGTAEGWKGQIALAIRSFIPSVPIPFPVALQLVVFIPRPKAHFRTGKNSHQLRDDAPKWCPKKPDSDNYAKAVMDAITTLRVWEDDSQVVDLRVRKFYESGRGPGCIISISEVLP